MSWTTEREIKREYEGNRKEDEKGWESEIGEREREREREKGAEIGRREMKVGHRRQILACCEFITEFLCIFLNSVINLQHAKICRRCPTNISLLPNTAPSVPPFLLSLSTSPLSLNLSSLSTSLLPLLSLFLYLFSLSIPFHSPTPFRLLFYFTLLLSLNLSLSRLMNVPS